MELLECIAPLFDGWQETMIWSCLQGCMGSAVADDPENPRAALITVGDFCFLAGEPSAELAAQATAPIIGPRDERWCAVIEDVWGPRVERAARYAIKKEPGVFDVAHLRALAAPPKGYALRQIDAALYERTMAEDWSRDLCALFADAADYARRGVGVVALCEGELVAGASSYAVYRGGIEIEIDTRFDYRRRGLATACGAALILLCLERGLYPSWDAHDLRSVALAEKLGYHMDAPYTVYFKRE